MQLLTYLAGRSAQRLQPTLNRAPWLERKSSTMVGDALRTRASSAVAVSADLKAGCVAVRLASKLCQVVQQQLQDGEKSDKDDSSPVTVADYGAQVLVGWSLSRSLGSISLIAEEDSADLRVPGGSGMLTRVQQLVNAVISEFDTDAQLLSENDVLDLIDMGRSSGGAQGTYWVLDPIDGTRGFVGMRQYAVCLGLIKDGEVVQGVLGCPNLPQYKITIEDGKAGAMSRTTQDNVGSLFIGVQNQGAFTGSLWSDSLPTKEIKIKEVANVEEVQFMESFESRHSNHGLTSTVAEALGVVLPPIRMDSQAKYGALSRGDAALFMRFPPPDYREKIWDHCAGYIIVQEAGGKITDASGAPLDFSKGRWLDFDRGIIAGSPAIHEQVLKILQQ